MRRHQNCQSLKFSLRNKHVVEHVAEHVVDADIIKGVY